MEANEHKRPLSNHYGQLAKAYLEKVILVHNTTIGQCLDQFICQSGFTTIRDSENKTEK